MAKPVNNMPPTRLPSVTGIWFHSHQSVNVTWAPNNMPTGMTNIFTTACSKPCEKNNTVGPQIARIFPDNDVVAKAKTTARLTIQLHKMPLVKTVSIPAEPCEA